MLEQRLFANPRNGALQEDRGGGGRGDCVFVELKGAGKAAYKLDLMMRLELTKS
jgi:hypothetical protein